MDRLTDPMTPTVHRFGRFELQTDTRELRADGRPLRLGERAFDLLLALAEAGGAVVERDTLFERAWPGRVVSDDNLKVQVMALRKLLGAEAVVTVPGRGYRLGLALRGPGDAEPAPRSSDVIGTLAGAAGPALLGRDEDLATLLHALAPGRLLSLVGPGGVGKTRLAAAVAEAARSRFADGVAWVDLASLADPAQVPAAVAQALHLPEAADAPARPLADEAVAQALRPLALLLVLDNCEHLLPAVATLVQAVRAAAPGVALLATSQEALALADERVQRLHGLACPPAGATDSPAGRPQQDSAMAPPAALDTPAVRLFAARAQAADPSFTLQAPGAAAAVAEICRRVDGLPLALELAAARVPLLGAAGVLQRLDQQLQLLSRGAADAPARQQTLRATMQWSHALLDEVQRTVFRRIGIFADSFTLAAALAVAGDEALDEWGVLDALDALVAKSLLRTDDSAGERRYRLLFSARAFAQERLSEAGEHAAAMRRLATHLVAVYDEAERRFHGAPLKPWTDALWPWVHDLRRALAWAAGPQGDAVLLRTLASAAGPFWAAAGLDREAARWLAIVQPLMDGASDADLARYCKALALRSVNPAAPVAEAVAAAERGWPVFLALGDTASAYRLLGIAAQHARRVDPARDVRPLIERMRALEAPDWTATQRMARVTVEGVLEARNGDWVGHRERFALQAAVRAEAGDELRAWGALYHVALAELALDRPHEAIAVLQPVVDRLRALNLQREYWTRPVMLVLARIEAGAGAAAAAGVREAITLMRVAGAPAFAADHLAWWAADCGEAETGARLLGWADAATGRRGQRRHAHAQKACERALARLAPQLSPARLQALRGEGAALDDELALAQALRLADALRR